MWHVTCVRIGLGRSGRPFFNNTPVVSAVTLTLQALPFPLRLRSFLLLPQLLRLPLIHPPLHQRGIGGRSLCGLLWGLLFLLPSSGGKGGGWGREGFGFWGRKWLGCFFPSGGRCGGVLSLSGVSCACAPSSIASSASAGRDHRSRSREVGGSTEDRSRSLFTVFSLARSRFSWRASLCLFAVWWVACSVSRVALSLHEPFSV